MRHITPYTLFESLNANITTFEIDVRAQLDYYLIDDDETEKLQTVAKQAKDLVKNVRPIPQTIVKHDDGSPRLVFHASNTEFEKFNTPAFFGEADGYDGDYMYCCAIDVRNPLDLRYHNQTADSWYDTVGEIFKEHKDVESKLEFARKYQDMYGFFKLTQDTFMSQNWQPVFDYVVKHGYDGVVYRESDQTISYYFNGYIVMSPDQIQIVYIK